MSMKSRCTEDQEDVGVPRHCPRLQQCMYISEVTDLLLTAVFLVEVFMPM